MPLAGLEEKFRKKNLKITPQRLEILRALMQIPDHPSAETIYQKVKRRYPAVSVATVYKTLETLVEIGEIRVALVSQGKTRYDMRMDRHHHFLCSQCGAVTDVDMNLNCLETCVPETMGHSYRVLRSEVVFHGICPHCQGEEKAPSSSPALS
jgi:Fur family peroxide stress response transcriptional regulator